MRLYFALVTSCAEDDLTPPAHNKHIPAQNRAGLDSLYHGPQPEQGSGPILLAGKDTLAKSFTFILVAIMALALMIFTASRTLDLLQLLLPANQSIFAYLALVAFDGGLLGWSLFFAYGARGQYQRAIALLMVIVSLAAIGITTIADLYLSAARKGLVDALSEQQRLSVLLAVGVVIFVNVAAFFVVHITEPGRLRAMATENANDKIHAKTLEHIQREAEVVAARLAPILAEQWVRETMASHLGGSALAKQPAAKSIDASLAPRIVASDKADESETLHLRAIMPDKELGQNGASPFHA